MAGLRDVPDRTEGSPLGAVGGPPPASAGTTDKPADRVGHVAGDPQKGVGQPPPLTGVSIAGRRAGEMRQSDQEVSGRAPVDATADDPASVARVS
eukprot:13641604-Alexandrium_andersonii.AAC.1